MVAGFAHVWNRPHACTALVREHSALLELGGLALVAHELHAFGGRLNSLFGCAVLQTPSLGDLGIVPDAEVVVTDEEGDSFL